MIAFDLRVSPENPIANTHLSYLIGRQWWTEAANPDVSVNRPFTVTGALRIPSELGGGVLLHCEMP